MRPSDGWGGGGEGGGGVMQNSIVIFVTSSRGEVVIFQLFIGHLIILDMTPLCEATDVF